MLSATEAKDLAQNSLLNKILLAIKNEAEDGYYAEYIPYHLDEYTINALKSLGYDVENKLETRHFTRGTIFKTYGIDTKKYCIIRWEK